MMHTKEKSFSVFTMEYQKIQDIPSLCPQPNSYKKTIFLILFFTTLTTFPLYLMKVTSLQSLPLDNVPPKKTCNVFNGTWVSHFDAEPYYTNKTCNLMFDVLNCMKSGRPDTDFLKWRWKPDECELPLFNATLFLNLVRGKSLAFVGDSIGKNQMFSLLCLLTQKIGGNDPDGITPIKGTQSGDNQMYKFHDYNFTVSALWAPFLVQSEESDPNGYSPNSQMNLYLDEPNPSWSTEVENFDFVVVSAGQWFFRPSMLFHNRTLIGCSNCPKQNTTTTTDLLPYYSFRQAFRTVFQTLLGLENYRGVTFLRTFSPPHFENGNWSEGCERRKPFGREEVAVPWYIKEMRRVQVEELAQAKEVGENKGLVFQVMDTTEAMHMRPDGHPNFYGRLPGRNMDGADCVHWCTPGPIDALNEFLLYLLNQL